MVKHTIIAFTIGVILAFVLMRALGLGWTEMTFLERTGVMLVWAIPIYFIAQPEWEREDARRRERKRREHAAP